MDNSVQEQTLYRVVIKFTDISPVVFSYISNIVHYKITHFQVLQINILCIIKEVVIIAKK